MVTAHREGTTPVTERRAFSIPGLAVAVLVIAAAFGLIAWIGWLVYSMILNEEFDPLILAG